MKSAADHSSAICQPASSCRNWILGVGCWLLLFHFIASASALTEANPYSKIIGRNTFALKAPPPPPAPLVAPPAPPPKVSLQGISTILGRAQALLKVKIDPKPSEPAKELSLVMDVGQREGDVEVLSIDPATGTVNLSNQGTPLTLSIKDADKPVAGPAIAAAPPLANLPGIAPSLPPPVQVVPPAPQDANKTAVPTRLIRSSSNAPGVGQNLTGVGDFPNQPTSDVQTSAGSAQGGQISNDQLAASVITYEANRLRREKSGSLLRFPPHPSLKSNQSKQEGVTTE